MMKLILGLLALSQVALGADRNLPADSVQWTLRGSAPSSPTVGTAFGYFLSSDSAPYFKLSSGTAYGFLYSAANLTNHGVVVGTGTRAAATIAACTNNQAIFGSTGADPSCRAITLADFPSQADKTILGNDSGGSAVPVALTATQVNEVVGSADLTLSKALATAQASDSSTGNIDSLTTTNLTSIRLTGAAPALRGIAGGAAGKVLLLLNASGVSVAVKNQDANPTAANRIITGTGVDLSMADTSALLLQYDGTTSRWRVVGGSGGGGSGSALTQSVTQTTHGFAVGDLVYNTGSAYAKAKADSDSTSEVVGIVSAVASANAFTLQSYGYVTGLSGLTAGTTYYLSSATAGALASSAPTTIGYVSKPVLIADSTTSGFFVNMRGVTNAGAAPSFGLACAISFTPSAGWAISTSSFAPFTNGGQTASSVVLTNGFTTAAQATTVTPAVKCGSLPAGTYKVTAIGNFGSVAATEYDFTIYDGTNHATGWVSSGYVTNAGAVQNYLPAVTAIFTYTTTQTNITFTVSGRAPGGSNIYVSNMYLAFAMMVEKVN